MTRGIPSRREFLKHSGAIGAGLLLGIAPSTAFTYQANEKLSIGIVGVANRGGDNLAGVSGQQIAALCDVDENYLGRATHQYPDAKTLHDFRKLTDVKGLDAVVISTPDHVHAPATAWMLKAGLHVYCEKPLTHTVEEARVIARLAAEHKRVTQLGTQIHAGTNYRRVVELVKGGAIGTVNEVHVWCDRVRTAGGRPFVKVDTPPTMHWDLWLGTAPPRPYHPCYAPAGWRNWWDFGNGTLGDMGCHHMDLPFWALDLRHPATVRAEGPPVDPQNAPDWMIVRYTFPTRGSLPALPVNWYQGGKRPPQFAESKLPKWGDGTLFVGSKGMLLCDYDRRVLLPETDFKGFVPPAPTIPDSVGHHEEWIRACKAGSPTTCNFDYGGALTEAVLLGNAAYRSGERIIWDAEKLEAKGAPIAQKLLRKNYDRGWNL